MATDVVPHFAAVYRWLVISHQIDLPSSSMHLLDVGTDDGFIAMQVPARFRVGVDVAPRGVGQVGLSRVSASAERLPFAEGHFDCVLAIDVLEHLSDDASAMREMLRTLSPDGTLWFTTPARQFRLIPAFLTARANRGFGHRRNGYAPDEISALTGAPASWTVESVHWNEPVFRACFALMHLVHLVWPALAARMAVVCYSLDRHFAAGDHGHIVGSIRRSNAGGM